MIEEKNVKVPFRKLKYIHHMSDIQIRNLKRHKEYEEVFERTYEEVKIIEKGISHDYNKIKTNMELVEKISFHNKRENK